MKKREVSEAYEKLNFYEEDPKVGEYFGVITTITYIIPYYSEKTSYTYSHDSVNDNQMYPFLFKKIDEETFIEVSTGIPFVLNPYYLLHDCGDKSERIKIFQEKLQKYRKIGLRIDEINYIKVDDEFKLLYSKEMNQELKDKLKDYAKIAHEQFDNAFTEIVNRMHNIALVDNAIYDMEQKCKTKSLTKPNDDQK